MSCAEFDVIIIGGGATGLGAALDSASRGFKTLLLEKYDFAKGTSSKSSKLIHGGLRYLKQGQLSFVKEALFERSLLFQNAPHLISELPIAIPCYHFWEKPFYGLGLKVYDALAGKSPLPPSSILSRHEILERVSGIKEAGLLGGVLYYDGQFDDARFAISLAKTAIRYGATLQNYCGVSALIKKNGRVVGVKTSSGDFLGKVVINATGVFVDEIKTLDDKEHRQQVVMSQGTHIVLPKEFLPLETAILIPKTDDQRVMLIMPWEGRVLIGTTDTPLDIKEIEPRAREEEVEFLLKTAAKYLRKAPSKGDILSVFAGLRPLLQFEAKKVTNTSKLSRDFFIDTSPSSLITISGGKWTLYRKMGEKVIDQAIVVGKLSEKPSITKNLMLAQFQTMKPALGEKLAPGFPYTTHDVVVAVQEEMAKSVEDVLARRVRLLFLDAKAAIKAAPLTAATIAKCSGHSKEWEEAEVRSFVKMASAYCVS